MNRPRLDSAAVLAWLHTKTSHNDCEDCWYSCATLTCDDRRKNDVCDCGADRENEIKAYILQHFSPL